MKTKGKLKEKQGISLIVLVITIIVIIILAVAVILSIANNNPISNANKAKFQSDLKSIQEELDLYNASEYTNSHTKGTTYVPATLDNLSSATKYKDSGKLVIQDGNLYVDASKLSNDELAWANEIGITEAPVIYTKIEIPTTATSEETAVNGLYISNKQLMGNYTGTDKNIELSSEIESIGTAIFYGNQNIQNVIVPGSVLTTGLGVFGNCINLKKVEFKGNMSGINTGLFEGCINLKEVVLPDGIERINQDAFKGCTSLESLTLPDSVWEMYPISDAGSFVGCDNLVLTITENSFNNLKTKSSYYYANVNTAEDLRDLLGVKEVIIK